MRQIGAALMLCALRATSAELPDLTLYQGVLADHVKSNGRVDYAALKRDGRLSRFTKQLAEVSPDSHPALFPDRGARLAYWINAYNALVLESFAREYPEKRTRLKGLLGKAHFFYRMKHTIGGQNRSLDHIETESIRKAFGDPRIHFAIVCASESCPWLSSGAYTAGNVERKLDEETRRNFEQDRNFRLDEGKREIWLPRIFDWFKEDFGSGPKDALAFVARYRPAERARLESGSWKIRYFDYDWSPNDIRR